MIRRLYDFVLELSRRPTALPALTVLSWLESMIFPIPPDVMLIPMCVAEPKRAMRYAAWCSIGSVLGGICGYAIGMFFWDQLGPWFFEHVPGITEDGFATVEAWFAEYDFVIVFAAGFSPIPYKLFTLSAGIFEISFAAFLVASATSRSARFFLVAWLLKRWGVKGQEFIDKHLNTLALLFVVLLVGAFMVLKVL